VDAPVSVLNKPYKKNGNNMNKKTILAASICAALSAPAWSLNILVANDDGCTSEGINTLMTELESRGHEVTMYAPAGEQSGKAGSVETKPEYKPYRGYAPLTNAFLVSNNGFATEEGENPTEAENRLCVRISATTNPEEGSDLDGGTPYITASATPADSVRVGIAAMTNAGTKPDLIISGINHGQNIGISTTGSGTVGVAVTGLLEGIPSIAVSNYRDFSWGALLGAAAPLPSVELSDVSIFIADLVAELEENQIEGQPLLPAYTGLNINMPTGTPKGIAHTELGHSTALSFTAALDPLEGPVDEETGLPEEGDGNYHPTITLKDYTELVDPNDLEGIQTLLDQETVSISDLATAGLDTNDETQMYTAGFITISVIDGDFSASLRKQELLKVKLRDVSFNASAADEAL